MTRLQLIVLAICLSIGAGLFFFGKMTALKSESATVSAEAAPMDSESLLLISRSALNAQEQDKLADIEKALDTVKAAPQREALCRSLAAFWETKSDWGAAAVWYERAAAESKNALAYALAGTRYLAAADMATDTILLQYLQGSAIRNFESAEQLDPENLDIQADLGQALTVGTSQPMQGIQKLLGIVQKEPKHLKANFHLAQLAIRSEQHDKAEKRFRDILGWYPGFADAYLGLGEALYKQGKTTEAIQALEDYKALSKDPGILAQVDNFIQQIKSSTP
jgi:outer membrane protein